MTALRLLRGVLVFIAWATVASGLVQLVSPGLVLTFVGGDQAPASRHFFGIVGMFMVLFGGALAQGLGTDASEPADRIVLLWAGLQKLGASAAVGLGVERSLFAPIALAVAGFDLLSGILIFVYRAKAGGAPPG
jgi:hypothetical protein